MALQMNLKRRSGDLLIEKSIVTREQLAQALATQESEPEAIRRRLGAILTDDFGIDRHTVMKHIADFYAFRDISSVSDIKSEERIHSIKRILESLPKESVDELVHRKTVPFRVERNNLILASADPTDPVIISLVDKLGFKSYEITYCRLELVEDILSRVYEQKNEFLDLLEEIELDDSAMAEQEVNEAEIDAEINQSMLNSLVEGMLIEAVRQGVSDIHIIPGIGNTTDIHFRIDGKLMLWHTQTGVKPEALSAVVKDKTRNVDRFERDSSQDGFIQRKIDNHNLRFRVSIMPIVGQEFERKFESIVIRILDDRKVITDLNKLGLQKQAFKDFNKAIRKPSGIVIITGPTGSGKSTTLVAALYSVIDPSVNVLTVEEPVEYLIRGARQLKISDNMTFDMAIRGILRHDPDIVLVGEIRDLKTAEIAIKLANTGHLTFSTLHTNDAPSAVARLFKMGVEPFLIASAVNLVMAQRLIRRLCQHCKAPIRDIDPELPRSVGFTDAEIAHTTFYGAVGCDKCNKGYKGRVAIHEALFFDKNIKSIIFASGDDIDEDQIREQAIKNGMLTMRASGRERIKEGSTTIEEIIAITIED
ncbi:MAG: type IV pilus assembly protein PilB [Bacteroidetes bacterium HLUCCA01]|nr:MAG: type IV pilus assembly protein PilB [Bacteroidetes bacterium HLUCCA01]